MKVLVGNVKELKRLVDAFADEARRFHSLRLSTFSVSQRDVSDERRFARPNHAIMLWQYYGVINGEAGVQRFDSNVQTSNISLAGLRGAEYSLFGLLEGEPLQLFLRMARRAGLLFDSATAHEIKTRVTKEIVQKVQLQSPEGKPLAVSNNNPVSVWLNYLLYHYSLMASDHFGTQIDQDPFALSLLALERLSEEREISKVDRSMASIDEIQFKVALSFPGEQRQYVAEVANRLRAQLGDDAVFYDYDYQSQLARPNLDLLLQDIFGNRSELIVVFLCASYQSRTWCGLEWRSIRTLIAEKQDARLMLVRFDDNKVDGLLSIDGYLDARKISPIQVANLVVERLRAIPLPRQH